MSWVATATGRPPRETHTAPLRRRVLAGCLALAASPAVRIATPTVSANLAFGGADGRCLFIAAGRAVHAIDLRVAPRGGSPF